MEAQPLVPPLPRAALNHLLHGICGTSRHGMARYLQGAWKAESGADYSQATRRVSIDQTQGVEPEPDLKKRSHLIVLASIHSLKIDCSNTVFICMS